MELLERQWDKGNVCFLFGIFTIGVRVTWLVFRFLFLTLFLCQFRLDSAQPDQCDCMTFLRCKCECNIDVLNCGRKSTGIQIIPWKLSVDKASLRLSLTAMHVEPKGLLWLRKMKWKALDKWATSEWKPSFSLSAVLSDVKLQFCGNIIFIVM